MTFEFVLCVLIYISNFWRLEREIKMLQAEHSKLLQTEFLNTHKTTQVNVKIIFFWCRFVHILIVFVQLFYNCCSFYLILILWIKVCGEDGSSEEWSCAGSPWNHRTNQGTQNISKNIKKTLLRSNIQQNHCQNIFDWFLFFFRKFELKRKQVDQLHLH